MVFYRFLEAYLHSLQNAESYRCHLSNRTKSAEVCLIRRNKQHHIRIGRFVQQLYCTCATRHHGRPKSSYIWKSCKSNLGQNRVRLYMGELCDTSCFARVATCHCADELDTNRQAQYLRSDKSQIKRNYEFHIYRKGWFQNWPWKKLRERFIRELKI